MKTKILKTLVLVLFLFSVFFLENTNAETIQSYSDQDSTIVASDTVRKDIKKIDYGNGLEYTLTIVYFAEDEDSTEEDGTTIYTRSVQSDGILSQRKDNSIENIFEHRMEVKFTYDKKSFVKISSPYEDIVCEKTRLIDDKNWTFAQTCEILQGQRYCLVSEMVTAYRKYKHIENGHIDVACDIFGSVLINSKFSS